MKWALNDLKCLQNIFSWHRWLLSLAFYESAQMKSYYFALWVEDGELFKYHIWDSDRKVVFSLISSYKYLVIPL